MLSGKLSNQKKKLLLVQKWMKYSELILHRAISTCVQFPTMSIVDLLQWSLKSSISSKIIWYNYYLYNAACNWIIIWIAEYML